MKSYAPRTFWLFWRLIALRRLLAVVHNACRETKRGASSSSASQCTKQSCAELCGSTLPRRPCQVMLHLLGGRPGPTQCRHLFGLSYYVVKWVWGEEIWFVAFEQTQQSDGRCLAIWMPRMWQTGRGRMSNWLNYKFIFSADGANKVLMTSVRYDKLMNFPLPQCGWPVSDQSSISFGKIDLTRYNTRITMSFVVRF